MRTIGTMMLGLAALCTLNATAHAQGRGGMMGGGMMLYTNASVQKELKLTEDQTKKVAEVAKDVREKYADKMAEARESQDREQQMKLTQEMTADLKKAMADVLTPEQAKRFGQIQLQSGGVQALMNPETAKKMGLTDDQKDKLKTLAADMQTEMRELFPQMQDDREGTMKKMAELRKETMGKVTAMLTDDQKKTWKEMTGEPFEVKMDAPRRGN